MSKIQVLDDLTINRIAAGEVIERPASVVKELLENSIDAGATKIQIHIKQGGIKEIQVTDNGAGITKEDLPLSISRHATSKIRSLEDIYESYSMGFRGEALASIAHISSLTIVSKSEGETLAYELSVENGVSEAIKQSSHPQGTSIYIRDLFQKVPVRRKYLKSEGAEFSAIFDYLRQFALIYPEIDFVLKKDGEERLNTTGISDPKVLLSQFYGKSIKSQLIKVTGTHLGITLSAWISDPTLTFPTRAKQLFSVNRRIVKSPILQKIIMDLYRDLIPARRFPLLLLGIEISSDAVDVNIHPKKEELKFLNPDTLFKVIPPLLKQAFSREHSIMTPADLKGSPAFSSYSSTKPFSGSSSSNTASAPLRLVPLKNSPHSENSASPVIPISEASAFRKGVTEDYGQSFSEQSLSRPKPLSAQSPLFRNTEIKDLQSQDMEYFQIFDTYLVVKALEGLWLLDQHAVHERILYERFKENHQKAQGNQQPLLISEVITVTPDIMSRFEAQKEELLSLGLVIEVFGQDQLIVRELPSEFSGCDISQWVLLFFEEKELLGLPSVKPDLKEALQMKACKAAIKAGKRMHPDEVKQLIYDFVCSASNFTCPHGRPLFIEYKKEDLEKLFSRR